jgi:hypothetical protein
MNPVARLIVVGRVDDVVVLRAALPRLVDVVNVEALAIEIVGLKALTDEHPDAARLQT